MQHEPVQREADSLVRSIHTGLCLAQEAAIHLYFSVQVLKQIASALSWGCVGAALVGTAATCMMGSPLMRLYNAER